VGEKKKIKLFGRTIHATLRERQQRSFLDIPAVRDLYTHIRLFFFVCARLVVVERQPAISQQFFDFLLRCFFGTSITFPRSQSRSQCANPNVIDNTSTLRRSVCHSVRVNNTYPTRLFIELCCRPLYTRPWLRIFTITRTKKNRKILPAIKN
jgi:hypothetical protein